MTFGLPWLTFWQYASPAQLPQLLSLLSLIEEAGATIVNNTELPSREKIIDPAGWNWDFGAKRGHPNESEYTVVKTDFYNDIKAYLSELNNTNIRSLEDIFQYNIDNVGTEGGLPGVHPAFSGGQDGFNASLQTLGIMDDTYFQALSFMHRATREDGIDAALNNNGCPLTALLVPSDLGQVTNVAAQAGYPLVTLPAGVNKEETGMPFGLGLMGSAWSESTLVGAASAIEDLQFSCGTELKRTTPRWLEYLARNVPINNV